LVLFRDEAGRLGLLDAYCPHEGGSLAAGCVVDGGLQCMLHGWAFDVTGQRVDGGAKHQGAARTTAYPTAERDARVWAYLGLPEQQPALA
jgi:phenylpropionate dioxygenase-like ring-hydroxylating dioxygenase large terminal subunit